jgi:hypothetical protein
VTGGHPQWLFAGKWPTASSGAAIASGGNSVSASLGQSRRTSSYIARSTRVSGGRVSTVSGSAAISGTSVRSSRRMPFSTSMWK